MITDKGFTARNMRKIDVSGLKILNLQEPPYPVLHWLAVLSANRKFQPETALSQQGLVYLQTYFLPDLDQYDLIRGYRADDSYFSFGFEPADGSIYYPKRKQRDESARLKYRQLAMQTDLDGIYMRDILRDKIMPGDKRLDKQ